MIQLTPELLTALRAKPRGKGKWMAHCPSHEDSTPSLSLREGVGGIALWHCHAGCSADTVLAALRGISGADGASYAVSSVPGPPSREHLGVEEARYDYRDASGELAYQVLRFEGKQFRPRLPNGRWELPAEHRVLYRLPELLRSLAAGNVVAIVEGEKDADNLHLHGLCATTFDGGASKAPPDGWVEVFRGAHVALFPDNDDVGRAFMHRLANALLCVAASVKVVALPDIPQKGDVSDWLGNGGTRLQLDALIEAAPEYRASSTSTISKPDETHALAPAEPMPRNDRPVQVHMVTLSEVEAEAVEWLWRGYVPFGKLTVLEGDPGLSKSTWTIWLAAALSRGLPLPDGTRHPAADSLFITYEDGIADTLKPRAEIAGGDTSRIRVVTGVSYNNDEARLFSLSKDVVAIRKAIEDTQARLVVIDPLDAALGAGIDSHKGTDVRQVLAPLAKMAEQTGAAVIVVRHLTKQRSGSAITAGLGSIGITGAARMVLAVHRHPDEDARGDRRVLAVVKCNIARVAPSRTYTLVSEGEHARIEWGGESPLSADALSAERADEEERSAIDEAVDFLREALSRGPVSKADLRREAVKNGIADRTLARASRKLGVLRVRVGFPARAMWALPSSASSQATAPSYATRANSGDVGITGTADEGPASRRATRGLHGTTGQHGTTEVNTASHTTHASHHHVRRDGTTGEVGTTASAAGEEAGGDDFFRLRP